MPEAREFIVRPRAAIQYPSQEAADADLDRYLGELSAKTGWERQTIHEQGSQRVLAKLAELSIDLVDVPPEASAD